MVRYWPMYHKGFSYQMETENLILARNLNLADGYKMESDKNVLLSSERVKSEAIDSSLGNKLTPILYSKIFNIFGFKQNLPIFVSLILYALTSILLFLLVLKKFNFKIALIFSFFEIFSPLVLQHSIVAGSYEWAMFFVTLGLVFYFYRDKINYFNLLISGSFLAIASLARNSVIIIPIAFLVYGFFKNKSLKKAVIFILPLLLLWGIYLGPGIIKNGSLESAYLSSQENVNLYMHIFPDQYTWYYDRDNYIQSIKSDLNYDQSQFLLKYGYDIPFKDKVLMYFASAKSYFLGFFNQTTFGGPFLVLLMILGIIYLYKNKKELLELFGFWTIFTYLFLIVMKSNHLGHFLTLQFPIFLLISLGLYSVLVFVKKSGLKNSIKYIIFGGLFIALFIHLIQSDKWVFHEGYLYSNSEQTFEMINLIKAQKEKINNKKDVLSSGLCGSTCQDINYYADVSCVCFDPLTVEKLLGGKKLQWAFDQFGVTRIIGYDDKLAEEIVKNSNVLNLGTYDK